MLLKAWLAFCGVVRRLPNFRGKVRALLLIHSLLGYNKRHIQVEATLHRPCAYHVRLDLFCHHERMAFFMDVYEEGSVEFLSSILDPQGCFLDIGANIGLISIPFAAFSRANQRGAPFVYCVEALKDNQHALAANIRLNGLQAEMRCVDFAVGETNKEVEIQVERDLVLGQGTGTANIVPAGGQWKCLTNRIKVRTIDSLLRDGILPSKISLIKIDTDGYDLFAMMGARELLRHQRPIVFGEFMEHCLRWHGQSIVQVDQFFRELDYELFTRINPHSNDWRFQKSQDYAHYQQDVLCIPKEKLHFVERYLA